MTEQTGLEWDNAGNKLFEVSTLTRYDDWGNPAAVTFPTGVTGRSLNDPIALRTESWQESASGKRSSRQVVLRNIAGSPIKHELYDNQDARVRTVLLKRDGLDRVVEQRTSSADSHDVVTQYRYDSYSRLVEQVLPDGSLVTWAYATHSDGEHPQSVKLTEALSHA